jgi:hypothetical protein
MVLERWISKDLEGFGDTLFEDGSAFSAFISRDISEERTET